MEGTDFNQPLVLIREKCDSCGGTGVDINSAQNLAYEFQSRMNNKSLQEITTELRCYDCKGLGYEEEHKTLEQFEDLLIENKTVKVVEG